MIMVLAAQLHIFISRPSQELSNELMLLVDKQSAHKHYFLVHICLRPGVDRASSSSGALG